MSLLAAAAHTQGGSSVFTKSPQPLPELWYSNQLGVSYSDWYNLSTFTIVYADGERIENLPKSLVATKISATTAEIHNYFSKDWTQNYNLTWPPHCRVCSQMISRLHITVLMLITGQFTVCVLWEQSRLPWRGEWIIQYYALYTMFICNGIYNKHIWSVSNEQIKSHLQENG